MNHSPIEIIPDRERVFVHGESISKLATLLDPTVPWVWILDHWPHRYIQWWQTTVPLNNPSKHGARHAQFTGLVRNLRYDMQLSTREFIDRATEFDDHGITLIQSHHQMPDTLCLGNIQESALHGILLQNGATLRIYSPHKYETALVESFTPGYLAKALLS